MLVSGRGHGHSETSGLGVALGVAVGVAALVGRSCQSSPHTEQTIRKCSVAQRPRWQRGHDTRVSVTASGGGSEGGGGVIISNLPDRSGQKPSGINAAGP